MSTSHARAPLPQLIRTLTCAAALALPGCMPGGYVPPAPAADAKTCPDLSGPVESSAPDWPHDQLVDLEASLRDGIAIVKYDCHESQLLRDCRVAGSYRYMSLELRADLYNFPNPEEVRRGFPHTGDDLVARLESRYSGSVSADLMQVRVGSHITDRAAPGPADLQGGCQGATHFVRSIDVGAWSLSAGSGSTPLKTPFGESAVQRDDTLDTEGNQEACKRGEPDAQAPPDGCGSPLRVNLEPLVKK